MRLHIGQNALRGDIGRYAHRFNLVELASDPGEIARPGKLRDLKARAPEGFVFSLVLPTAVASLEPSALAEKGLVRALASAEALNAEWIVLRTPPAATPSARTRRRLGELAGHLPPGRRVAWEAQGLWEEAAAHALATDLGWDLVRDLTRSEVPERTRIYARLRALGGSHHVGSAAAERVAARLVDLEEAFVVLEGTGAVAAAQLIRGLVAADAEGAENALGEDVDFYDSEPDGPEAILNASSEDADADADTDTEDEE